MEILIVGHYLSLYKMLGSLPCNFISGTKTLFQNRVLDSLKLSSVEYIGVMWCSNHLRLVKPHSVKPIGLSGL